MNAPTSPADAEKSHPVELDVEAEISKLVEREIPNKWVSFIRPSNAGGDIHNLRLTTVWSPSLTSAFPLRGIGLMGP